MSCPSCDCLSCRADRQCTCGLSQGFAGLPQQHGIQGDAGQNNLAQWSGQRLPCPRHPHNQPNLNAQLQQNQSGGCTMNAQQAAWLGDHLR